MKIKNFLKSQEKESKEIVENLNEELKLSVKSFHPGKIAEMSTSISFQLGKLSLIDELMELIEKGNKKW